ncbi:MAG: response regulator [Oligoflexia bacterium]|nr:response regulator [Oligoflexia bacterium]
MAKILLADDDDYFRTALKAVIKGLGHEVTEVGDGKGAQHILGLQSFDLLISDIRMPSLNGIQLLQWTKSNMKVPVILITGFSEILETKMAGELGADDFLLKPFRTEDIKKAITRLTDHDAPKAEPEEDLDDRYAKIPIDDFISGSKINFNIYIRISSARYVRIAYQGQDIVIERIKSYKAKGVKHLHLAREDFSKYVNFNLQLAQKLRDCRQISPEKKRNFLRYSGEVILEHVFVEGVNREEFEVAKEFVQTMLGILQDHDEALALLDALNDHADFLYAHCLGVSLYASLIARSMNWTSTPVQFKISLAGLMHDIGLKEIARPILEKQRAAMSQEERSIYETHPVRSMELLSQIQGIPDEIVQIASHHHENCIGSGYPHKLSRNKIHPLSRLIAIADVFCEYAIRSPDRPNLPAIEVIQKMTQVHESVLDPECFSAFKRTFEFDELAEITSKSARRGHCGGTIS